MSNYGVSWVIGREEILCICEISLGCSSSGLVVFEVAALNGARCFDGKGKYTFNPYMWRAFLGVWLLPRSGFSDLS